MASDSAQPAELHVAAEWQNTRLESRVSWVQVPPEAAHFSLKVSCVAFYNVTYYYYLKVYVQCFFQKNLQGVGEFNSKTIHHSVLCLSRGVDIFQGGQMPPPPPLLKLIYTHVTYQVNGMGIRQFRGW